ncbi:MAG: CcoQ/FixQ family Cbb3-type cytochrome c oxidase assembly chaperone [Bacteroidota bacterium]|nr:CcoQ/FixQ family Cbb3-type cytochrome c oxidase assembly chaperone [Bacteroidota bacterium]
MKFINYLESITDIGVYPLVALLIFFLFFIGVAFYVILARKEYFDTLSNLPLRSSETDTLIPNTTGYDEETK